MNTKKHKPVLHPTQAWAVVSGRTGTLVVVCRTRAVARKLRARFQSVVRVEIREIVR
jgi:hypothetical protein